MTERKKKQIMWNYTIARTIKILFVISRVVEMQRFTYQNEAQVIKQQHSMIDSVRIGFFFLSWKRINMLITSNSVHRIIFSRLKLYEFGAESIWLENVSNMWFLALNLRFCPFFGRKCFNVRLNIVHLPTEEIDSWILDVMKFHKYSNEMQSYLFKR